MNPLAGGEEGKSFFGKHWITGLINQKKQKPWQYSVMKEKQIKKRRARNKMARISRRVNRLRLQ